jgi:hypothetical protein
MNYTEKLEINSTFLKEKYVIPSKQANRKPTSTDIIIPKHSCHPPEHKAAAINFLTNRRDTYCLDNETKEK